MEALPALLPLPRRRLRRPIHLSTPLMPPLLDPNRASLPRSTHLLRLRRPNPKVHQWLQVPHPSSPPSPSSRSKSSKASPEFSGCANESIVNLRVQSSESVSIPSRIRAFAMSSAVIVPSMFLSNRSKTRRSLTELRLVLRRRKDDGLRDRLP